MFFCIWLHSFSLSRPTLAIWSSAFNIDDPENQALADWWGVVMGTSHQEPMMRGTPIEWNLFGHGDWNYTTNSQNIYNYWVDGVKRARPFESIYTLGMRGQHFVLL